MLDPNLVSEDQPVELLPEEKVSLVVDLLSLALSDLVDAQGDIQLESLKGLALEFQEDGSVVLSLVPVEGDPISQSVESSAVESMLSDFVYDLQVEQEPEME